jgi:putative transposase
MTGEELHEVLATIVPDDVLMAAIEAAGFQERERKLEGLRFLRAMILSASTEYGGRQADIMRLYFQSGGPRVARASFYDWFGEPLSRVMEQVSQRALAYARAMPVDLPGVLGCVKDWRIVDATAVTLDDRLSEQFPATGAAAAVKIHKLMSVGRGTTVAYHFSPARDHDSKHLRLDESWRGYGLLADLAYANLKTLRQCKEYGVMVVVRLMENWRPKVERILRGEVAKTFAPGSDFKMLIAKETLLLRGKVIDAEVTIGEGDEAVMMRLVGVQNPTGKYNFYLTNLPRRVGPRQVADLYRVRWEIETDNKLNKSCHRLDQIDARKPEAVYALLHASMIASIVICILAHKHRLAEAPPPRRGTERRTPPIHPQSLARMIGHAALALAALLEIDSTQAAPEWQRLAEVCEHMGRDPNWRRSPSVLDQLRGWKISPGRPARERLASRHA